MREADRRGRDRADRPMTTPRPAVTQHSPQLVAAAPPSNLYSVLEVQECGQHARRSKRAAHLRVGTLNVAGIDQKRAELGDVMAELDLDIIAVQETWLKGDKAAWAPGYVWVGRNRASQPRRGAGGVGIFYRLDLRGKVKLLKESKYEGLLWVTVSLVANEQLHVGCFYSPREGTDTQVMRGIYDELMADIERLSATGRVVLVGDFNARVGHNHSRVARGESHACSQNGTRLRQLLEVTNMYVINDRHEKAAQPTRRSPTSESVIDYMVVDHALWSRGAGAQVATGHEVGSDHLLVWSELPLQPARIASGRKKTRYRWRVERLQSKPAATQRADQPKDAPEHAASVFNRVLQQGLGEWKEEACNAIAQDQVQPGSAEAKQAVERLYARFMQQFENAATVSVGKVRVTHLTKSWWDSELTTIRKQRRAAYVKAVESQLQADWNEYYTLRANMHGKVNQKRRKQWLQYNTNMSNSFKDNPARFWKLAGRLCGRFTS
jgi:hypothetical protein